MLKEAHRVLKPGSSACFSIWVDNGKSLQFAFVEKFMSKYGSTIDKDKLKVNKFEKEDTKT